MLTCHNTLATASKLQFIQIRQTRVVMIWWLVQAAAQTCKEFSATVSLTEAEPRHCFQFRTGRDRKSSLICQWDYCKHVQEKEKKGLRSLENMLNFCCTNFMAAGTIRFHRNHWLSCLNTLFPSNISNTKQNLRKRFYFGLRHGRRFSYHSSHHHHHHHHQSDLVQHFEPENLKTEATADVWNGT